jgi:hypothetical protein
MAAPDRAGKKRFERRHDMLGLVACAGLVEPVTEVCPCLVNEMPSLWSAACSLWAFDTARFRPAPAAVSLKSWRRLLPSANRNIIGQAYNVYGGLVSS